MKDKTQAAKILLEAGWTWEEIEAVLDMTDKPNTLIINNPSPPLSPVYLQPIYIQPVPPLVEKPSWERIVTTCDSYPARTITNQNSWSGNSTTTLANNVSWDYTQ